MKKESSRISRSTSSTCSFSVPPDDTHLVRKHAHDIQKLKPAFTHSIFIQFVILIICPLSLSVARPGCDGGRSKFNSAHRLSQPHRFSRTSCIHTHLNTDDNRTGSVFHRSVKCFSKTCKKSVYCNSS